MLLIKSKVSVSAMLLAYGFSLNSKREQSKDGYGYLFKWQVTIRLIADASRFREVNFSEPIMDDISVFQHNQLFNVPFLALGRLGQAKYILYFCVIFQEAEV